MSFIENIYICLGAPLLVAIFCLHRRGRRIVLFLLAGATVCLLSSYISTYIAAVMGMESVSASVEIAPFIEELMKFIPVLFYLLVYEPTKEDIVEVVIMTAVGFATFENACYLSSNGAADIVHLLIRGFGAGSMHVVCGLLVALGILYLWDRVWLQLAGTMGLLSLAITFHGVYNILVSQTGAAAMIGYFFPVLSLVLTVIFRGDIFPKEQKEQQT